ncbi:adenylate/guanylate cyclase domain-containing protein [Sorangium sp. So ce119]|uniref:adenylate/guanylate cyclase domain-containing protein n=1 Tax=Sorangium sp. So ce119 TaxID=3133279 RepID=UPI003F614348
MALADDLNSKVIEIFATNWKERQGRQVPEAPEVQLGNDAVTLQGAVLYADLAESTELVQNHKPQFAAEVYKAYLYCASKIIASEGGVITAFDGDRVMGVFVGEGKERAAARCALKVNHAVVKIINPALEKKYPTLAYKVKQAVGIDTSALFVARTGIRGSNDLVWVGRAANYAAKLCSLREGGYASWITKDVYDSLDDSTKNSKGSAMWEARTWAARNITVYRSSWTWTP